MAASSSSPSSPISPAQLGGSSPSKKPQALHEHEELLARLKKQLSEYKHTSEREEKIYKSRIEKIYKEYQKIFKHYLSLNKKFPNNLRLQNEYKDLIECLNYDINEINTFHNIRGIIKALAIRAPIFAKDQIARLSSIASERFSMVSSSPMPVSMASSSVPVLLSKRLETALLQLLNNSQLNADQLISKGFSDTVITLHLKKFYDLCVKYKNLLNEEGAREEELVNLVKMVEEANNLVDYPQIALNTLNSLMKRVEKLIEPLSYNKEQKAAEKLLMELNSRLQLLECKDIAKDLQEIHDQSQIYLKIIASNREYYDRLPVFNDKLAKLLNTKNVQNIDLKNFLSVLRREIKFLQNSPRVILPRSLFHNDEAALTRSLKQDTAGFIGRLYNDGAKVLDHMLDQFVHPDKDLPALAELVGGDEVTTLISETKNTNPTPFINEEGELAYIYLPQMVGKRQSFVDNLVQLYSTAANEVLDENEDLKLHIKDFMGDALIIARAHFRKANQAERIKDQLILGSYMQTLQGGYGENSYGNITKEYATQITALITIQNKLVTNYGEELVGLGKAASDMKDENSDLKQQIKDLGEAILVFIMKSPMSFFRIPQLNLLIKQTRDSKDQSELMDIKKRLDNQLLFCALEKELFGNKVLNNENPEAYKNYRYAFNIYCKLLDKDLHNQDLNDRFNSFVGLVRQDLTKKPIDDQTQQAIVNEKVKVHALEALYQALKCQLPHCSTEEIKKINTLRIQVKQKLDELHAQIITDPANFYYFRKLIELTNLANNNYDENKLSAILNEVDFQLHAVECEKGLKKLAIYKNSNPDFELVLQDFSAVHNTYYELITRNPNNLVLLNEYKDLVRFVNLMVKEIQDHHSNSLVMQNLALHAARKSSEFALNALSIVSKPTASDQDASSTKGQSAPLLVDLVVPHSPPAGSKLDLAAAASSFSVTNSDLSPASAVSTDSTRATAESPLVSTSGISTAESPYSTADALATPASTIISSKKASPEIPRSFPIGPLTPITIIQNSSDAASSASLDETKTHETSHDTVTTTETNTVQTPKQKKGEWWLVDSSLESKAVIEHAPNDMQKIAAKYILEPGRQVSKDIASSRENLSEITRSALLAAEAVDNPNSAKIVELVKTSENISQGKLSVGKMIAGGLLLLAGLTLAGLAIAAAAGVVTAPAAVLLGLAGAKVYGVGTGLIVASGIGLLSSGKSKGLSQSFSMFAKKFGQEIEKENAKPAVRIKEASEVTSQRK